MSIRLLLPCCVLICSTALRAKEPLMTPPETPVLGEIDPLLIEHLYKSEDRDAGLSELMRHPEFQAAVEKHDLRLFSGPMLGRLSPNSASVWLRTSKPMPVTLVVSEPGAKPVGLFKGQTTADVDLTCVLTATGLQPFTEYQYDLLDRDGNSLLEGELPTFRTNPEVGSDVTFSVGFGGGARYNPPKERMWSTIAQADPHAFLFLGDNIYIDEPLWRNRQRAMYYRRQMRAEFVDLISQAGCYAIWDDHDFGANDVAGGPEIAKPPWKPLAWQVFRENWNNAAYGGGAERPGCWFSFTIGDVEFFMTDGRYYRDFKRGTMLGPEQKAWLKQSLSESKATFKVLCSGTLWTEHADKGGKDSWSGVLAERDEIFDLIDEQNIGGVLLLSADRHRTDIYKIERPNGYPLYEFETSKLTNDHTHKTRDKAIFSYNKGNFYGLLRFDFTSDDPTVTFECRSIDDELIHAMTLKRSELAPSGN